MTRVCLDLALRQHYLAIKSKDGVWIPPVLDHFLNDELRSWASYNGVTPAQIPGYWSQRSSQDTDPIGPKRTGKVILAFHGGAYVRMSAHPDDPTSNIARGLLLHVPLVESVLSVEYRLSKPNANAFPAALLDGLAAYVYLVYTLGYRPSDIIVEGDSAGANLGIALVRYLVENQGRDHVPDPPSGLIVLSPWADIGWSQLGRNAGVENEKSDYVFKSVKTDYARTVFCGKMGLQAAETNRYISPASLNLEASVSFKGFPDTLIVCGGAEILADIIRTLRDKMVDDIREKVVYYEAPDAFHDYMVFEAIQPERSQTFEVIAGWMLKLMN